MPLGNQNAFRKTDSAIASGSGSASVSVVGDLYALVGELIIVPERRQYLISGRLILDANSIIRTDGQVVVI